MSRRTLSGFELLNQACRCPCCRERMRWSRGMHLSVFNPPVKATCDRCKVVCSFTVATVQQVTVGAVMADWAKLVELPELAGDHCWCRTTRT